MTKLIHTLPIASLIVAWSLQAQQSPNPQQPQVQAQPVPCVTTSNSPNPSGNNTAIKVSGKWRQALNKQLQKVGDKTGLPMPDVPTEIGQTANAKPAPCPPQAVLPKNLPSAPPPAPKLPADITAVLHCNPSAPKDASGRSTTLVLPDPHDYALPKSGDFLVDSVVPDLAARTPCYLVKIDPKTSKSFVAQ